MSIINTIIENRRLKNKGDFMKYAKFATLVILGVCILSGCTNSTEEIGKLEDRITELESNIENQLELMDALKDVSESVDTIQEEIDQIKSLNKKNPLLDQIEILDDDFNAIKNDVTFLKQIILGESTFDREEILIGDTVAEMTLVDTNEDAGLQFVFEGEKRLTGKFQIINETDYWYDTVNFYVDNHTPDILPREVNDYRILWFNFENYDEAVEKLGEYGTEGTVTIVIDSYTTKLLEGCVVNQAHLVRVEEVQNN